MHLTNRQHIKGQTQMRIKVTPMKQTVSCAEIQNTYLRIYFHMIFKNQQDELFTVDNRTITVIIFIWN